MDSLQGGVTPRRHFCIQDVTQEDRHLPPARRAQMQLLGLLGQLHRARIAPVQRLGERALVRHARPLRALELGDRHERLLGQRQDARAWASGVRRELELLTTRVDSTCVIVNGSTGFGFSHGVRLLHVVVDPGLHERRPTRVFRR
jgi:hypothetical protein